MATVPPEIEAILKKQKLAEITNVSSRFHNYASICTNQKKEVVYLKVRLYPKLVSRKSFIKEALLTKFLSENFYKNKIFVTPKYYKSEINKEPEWMIREYTSGKRMGDVWGFSPEFVNLISAKEIADFLDFVRGSVTEKFKQQKKDANHRLFEQHNAAMYKKYFADYLLLSKKFIKAKQQKIVLEIFDRHENFMEENNGYLAHGDLHPGNFVYSRGKIVVHDWKYAHFDNPYFDFTFMWFLLWLNNDWREEFFVLEMKRARNSRLFLKYFFLSVLKLAPKMITILMQASRVSKSNRQKGISKIMKVFNQAINFLGSSEQPIYLLKNK